MEVGPSSQTMEKDHLPWSDFMVHRVNRPLNTSKQYKCVPLGIGTFKG